jgi:hypothetical protein
LCVATLAWPNAFRTCTRCERRGSQGLGIIIKRLLANAILLSLVRHKYVAECAPAFDGAGWVGLLS